MTDEKGNAGNGRSGHDGSGGVPPADNSARDRSVLAAEYALGTLDADDRANVQMLMAIDPAFAEAVADWERRLGELHALVEPVDAPPAAWDWLKARIAAEPQVGRLWLPSAEEIARTGRPTGEAAADVTPAGETAPQLDTPSAAPVTNAAPVLLWQSRARRWRRVSAGIGALAAALVALAVVRELRPRMLPEPLRPAERVVERPVEVVRTVEKVREIPSPRIAEYVAILQKDASSPAFMLTIDLSRNMLSVRRVGAEPQTGKDYELWLVSDRFPAPRSLGVVGEQEFTVRREVTAYDAPTLNAATYAVSLEPSGGSPTGTPTGPVLFTGRLMQTTPEAFPSRTP